MTTQMAVQEEDAALLERVLVSGDLTKLTPAQRVQYYRRTCESLGLNPLTKPFDYLVLNNRLVLYAKRDATDQLRKLHKVSVTRIARDTQDGILTVTATVQNGEGRTDEEVGCVPVAGLRGVDLANATMKAVTKAKRRATLSICGLGVLDESELDGVPEGQPVSVDENGDVVAHTTGAIHPQTGEVQEPAPAPDLPIPPKPLEDDKPASAAQRRFLFAVWRKHGLSEDQLRAFLKLEYGTQHTSELTGRQMTALLEHLQGTSQEKLLDYLRTLEAESGDPA
jgi:hypothetical protein